MSTRTLGNRALIASGLFFGLSVVTTTAAYADDVVVTNPVLQAVSFTSTATAAAPISLTVGSALTNQSIGNAVVKSNDADGFTVTVDSTNLGNLKNGSISIPYTLGVTGGTVANPDITTANVTVEDRIALVADCANSTGCSRPLTISIGATAMDGKPSGNYSDTLTFSIVNK